MSAARSERRRAARQPRGFDAMVKWALADGAARDLMQTIAEAQNQQATIEKFGLDPGMSPGCVSESGEPLKTRIAGVEAENRVIVVTRKSPFGPPVWLYATRAQGLALMTRPARAAFDHATAALGHSTDLIRAAHAALMLAVRETVAFNAMTEANGLRRDAAEGLGFPWRGRDIPGIDAAGRTLIIDKADDGRLRWRFVWRWRALVSQVSLERRALKLAVRPRPNVARATVLKARDALAEALKAAKGGDDRARLVDLGRRETAASGRRRLGVGLFQGEA